MPLYLLTVGRGGGEEPYGFPVYRFFRGSPRDLHSVRIVYKKIDSGDTVQIFYCLGDNLI